MARILGDSRSATISVAWTYTTGKTSHVESRARFRLGWHVELVFPQYGTEDVHQLVGDSPEGDRVMLARQPFLLANLL